MEKKLLELRDLCGRLYDLNAAAALLEWDQQVNLPPAANCDRARQLAAVQSAAHELAVSDRAGELLVALEDDVRALPPDDNGRCLVQKMKRDFDRARRLPAEFVEAWGRITGEAFGVWEKAKREDDFESFRPLLDRVFALARDRAGFFAPWEHIYDPLLEDFEPGMTTAEVRRIFDVLRSGQVKLLREIAEKPPVDDRMLDGVFPDAAQWKLGQLAATRIGFDWKRGRLDRAEHPFTTEFGHDDVRITTHIYERNLLSSLYSVLHEAGHAIYEQGIDRRLDRTPLGTGASLGLHESQSRLWENLVGRSRDFLIGFYPSIQAAFPERLGGVDVEAFYRAVNRVRPSLIRTEADEATYNLHVMLRLDLEIAMLEGTLEAADLPEAWRAKMVEYLGVAPESDRDGVLQDVHWATGGIGYFPTYALGNLIAVQVWDRMLGDMPELPEMVRCGDLSPLRDWLTIHLCRHGAKFLPADLLRQTVGTGIDPEPYLGYLRRKYGEIYAL